MQPVNVCAVGATAPCLVANANTLQGVSTTSGTNSGYALKLDGTLLAWGSNSNGQLGNGTTALSTTPVQVSGLGSGSGVVAVSAGDFHALALRSDATAMAWGSNGSGQLGNGTIRASVTPEQTFGLGVGSGVVALATKTQSTLGPPIRQHGARLGEQQQRPAR